MTIPSIEDSLNRRKFSTLPTPPESSTTPVEPIDVSVEIDLKKMPKKASPWTSVNIKVDTLKEYEKFARKHGTTAQKLITQLLDGWITGKK